MLQNVQSAASKTIFLAVLASADPKYPVSEWDRLLPQAELTLNLLWNSRVNPRLSSYAYLFGQFDFNTTPLAPAGTKVLVHEKPSQQASWAYHGVEGWYIGPSLHHYHCLKCYLLSMGGTQDADTVQFFPKQVPFPKVSTEDYLLQAATYILTVLKNPQPSHPTLTYGDATRNSIDHLARLLSSNAQSEDQSSSIYRIPNLFFPRIHLQGWDSQHVHHLPVSLHCKQYHFRGCNIPLRYLGLP